MNKFKLISHVFIPLFFFLGFSDVFSQRIEGLSLGRGYSIIPTVNYVSSAVIQLNAFSESAFERAQTEELSGGYGYGITIRKKMFNEDLAFGINVNYLYIYDNEIIQTFQDENTRVRARVTEELWMVPVEFTGYFNIPNFSDDIEIFLGGGLGAYFGDRKRTILNLESKTVSKQPGYSFLVLSGMEFLISKHFSGVFEIRFSQGEYTVKSEYPASVINSNGTIYQLDKNLNSKIYVDGLRLSLGVGYNF
ncbi:MAG: hypothetical protein KDD00_02835 [Ignavibacteriae bacterium]|nr:hypothetical protein [Ignavibacteriota bacterium]